MVASMIALNPASQGAARRLLLQTPVLLYRLGIGDILNSLNLMILVTHGRTSGLARYTPVEYRRHGSKTYAIAVYGTQAQWLRNLQENPDVLVQQGRHSFRAYAEVIDEPGERARAVHLFRKTAPRLYHPLIERLADYQPPPTGWQRSADDTVTIVRFTPVPGFSDLPPVLPTLAWVLPAIAVIGVLITILLAVLGVRRRMKDTR